MLDQKNANALSNQGELEDRVQVYRDIASRRNNTAGRCQVINRMLCLKIVSLQLET